MSSQRDDRATQRRRPFTRFEPTLRNEPSTADDATNVFAVVGEHRDDPSRLLVLGDDGQYYDYALTTGHAAPVEPDQSWRTDRLSA